MNRFNLIKFSFLFFILGFIGCSTYDAQYLNSYNTDDNQIIEIDTEIEHSFYLIGDGGKMSFDHINTNFKTLKKDLSNASKNTTVIFLGDNIYEQGMPKKKHPNRKNAELILDAQISLVKSFNGNIIFIPGNHDYYSDGVLGLEREADYITDKLNDKNAFLPKNGCPIKKVSISKNVMLIVIDSQWYLEDWDKNPTMNDNCDITTREGFFDEFEGLLKKNENKTILISLHHPMFTNGPHGGQFSMRQQLYPINNKVPLPIIGSFINLLRKTSGASPQDIQNPYYTHFKKRLITLAQKSDKAIFVSGHEHSLQYIENENKPQIISGSASKASAARVVNGGEFSYGGIGYAKINVYKNGSTWVYFYTENEGQQKLLFKKEIFPMNPIPKEYNFPENYPKTVKTSIYTKDETKKGPMFRGFWGDHYRKYYSTEVEVPTVLLDTLFGGLTPIRKGGGHQSRSIRLIDKEGREYIMRAMRKSATQYFQEVAFKDQFVDTQFDETFTEELLMDFYTMAHPYSSFANAVLSDAIGVYHTNPILYYVPKQNALGKYNEDYGDELYMIEERPAKGHGNLKSFGYSNKIINTEDMLNNLRKSDDFKFDEGSYIRARLYDMAIGDWDRHKDQWRWAEFKEGKKTIYRPVPRDRDQAFSSADGFFIGVASRLIRNLSLMQVYKDEMRSVKWFNLEAFPLDITLISESNLNDWIKQAVYIQEHLTNEVIEKAFEQLPIEVQDETIEKIKKVFKSRINSLQKIAEEYYNNIHKNAIVKGTDKDNWFDIERLENGITSIKIYNIKNGEKGKKIFEKTYSKKITREIWVYALDDDDVINVSGVKNNSILLRIIGGQNNDIYNITSGKKVHLYDFKSKKNTFKTNQGSKHLIDDYDLNSHVYTRLRHTQNQILPLIGANPDDGFRVGLKNTYTVHGLNGNPFTQQYILDLNYYFATKGLDLNFDLEIGNMIHDWNFHFESKFTSPNYTINYFGMGNETTNPDDELGLNYNRVKIGSIQVNPSLKWKGRMGAEFKIGGFYEVANVEKTVSRYVYTTPEVSGEQQDFIGVNTSYLYENYDNDALQTLGMKAALDLGWKSNLGNSKENNAYITPELSFNHKLDSNGKIVLATKMKGNIIIGSTFQFYNAASIGGKDGLRGYRNQRFTGNQSFYQNTDLRFNFRHIKTRLLPIQIGLLAGFDYGRVWASGEDSKKWKTSYGAGFWIVGAELINLNLSVFNADEGAYIRFGMGFGF